MRGSWGPPTGFGDKGGKWSIHQIDSWYVGWLIYGIMNNVMVVQKLEKRTLKIIMLIAIWLRKNCLNLVCVWPGSKLGAKVNRFIRPHNYTSIALYQRVMGFPCFQTWHQKSWVMLSNSFFHCHTALSTVCCQSQHCFIAMAFQNMDIVVQLM